MAVDGAAWRWNDDGSVGVVRWSPDETLDDVARATVDIGYAPHTLVSLSNVSKATIATARVSRVSTPRRGRLGGNFF